MIYYYEGKHFIVCCPLRDLKHSLYAYYILEAYCIRLQVEEKVPALRSPLYTVILYKTSFYLKTSTEATSETSNTF
jgi:hypothetical protein